MYCNKCGNELKVIPEQVGVDSGSAPVFHRFAYCNFCKTKIDLDAQQNNFQKPFLLKINEKVLNMDDIWRRNQDKKSAINEVMQITGCKKNVAKQNVEYYTYNKGIEEEKKRSTLGTIAGVLGGLALILPLPIFLSYIMGIVSFIIAIIDIALPGKKSILTDVVIIILDILIFILP